MVDIAMDRLQVAKTEQLLAKREETIYWLAKFSV